MARRLSLSHFLDGDDALDALGMERPASPRLRHPEHHHDEKAPLLTADGFYDIDGDGDVDEADKVVITIVRAVREATRRGHLSFTSVFRNLDKSGDGHLDKNELMTGLTSSLGIALSARDADHLMARFDEDGGGTIRVDELLQTVRAVLRAGRRAEEAARA